MRVHLLPASQHRAQPWKNGLGVSYTIADYPVAAGFDCVLWQVGATDIPSDCPFSSLPGLDRIFTVREGAGVELSSVDEAGHARVARVEPFKPYAFRGDWKTDCRLLAGPVKVFNVMTRRGRFAADVSLSTGGPLEGARDETLLAVSFPGLDAWRAEGDGGQLTLPAGTFAVVRIRPA